MVNWLYKGNKIENVEDFGEQTPFGFVYLISNTIDGRIYIGKKFLQHKKTKKLGKKVMAEQTGPGRKKTKEVSYAESDWKTYWSSSDELKTDITNIGEHNFKRTIIHLCPSKGVTNYLEAKEQMLRAVLEDSNAWYNSWIQCKVNKSHLRPLRNA